jgi:hypothetical protein
MASKDTSWCRTFKALLEMSLDILGVAPLAQNLQQVIIREEVEARKLLALGLTVVFKGFLDPFKLVIHVL